MTAMVVINAMEEMKPAPDGWPHILLRWTKPNRMTADLWAVLTLQRFSDQDFGATLPPTKTNLTQAKVLATKWLEANANAETKRKLDSKDDS
jgi:hypothetical protein